MSCKNFDGNKCATYSSNRLFVVTENKITYELQNTRKKAFCKIVIDNCYIVTGPRCDYLFLDCNDNHAYFVELKGKDVKHAIVQLDKSIDYLFPMIKNFIIHARAVVIRVNIPNIQNIPFILKFKKKLRTYKGTFVIKSKKLSEVI